MPTRSRLRSAHGPRNSDTAWHCTKAALFSFSLHVKLVFQDALPVVYLKVSAVREIIGRARVVGDRGVLLEEVAYAVDGVPLERHAIAPLGAEADAVLKHVFVPGHEDVVFGGAAPEATLNADRGGDGRDGEDLGLDRGEDGRRHGGGDILHRGSAFNLRLEGDGRRGLTVSVTVWTPVADTVSWMGAAGLVMKQEQALLTREGSYDAGSQVGYAGASRFQLYRGSSLVVYT